MAGIVRGLHVNPEGGVPKHPVETLKVHKTGCVGDKQNDTKHHGGPNRAVCLMEVRVMERLQASGHPIAPGTTGENVLVEGLDEGLLQPGVQLQAGEVRLTITADAPPCKTIRASFQNGHFKALSHQKTEGQTRWYASVQQTGSIRLGDAVRIINEGVQVGNP